MKTLFFAMLISQPLWAQSPQKAVKQLEEINRPASEVLCAEKDKELYSPLDALKDINSGKLTFLGREIFPGSGQNYTCVYKSETAYILYNNCMGNKKESSATDLEVISFTGDIVSFFIQNKDATVAVSATLRPDYDMTWRVSVAPSEAVSDKLTVADLKKYKEKNGINNGGCSIGSTFKAQDLNSKPFCYGGVDNPNWKTIGEKFWKEPTEDWYQTQKYLRKVVEGTKF